MILQLALWTEMTIYQMCFVLPKRFTYHSTTNDKKKEQCKKNNTAVKNVGCAEFRQKCPASGKEAGKG